jgi:hypothetical protein
MEGELEESASVETVTNNAKEGKQSKEILLCLRPIRDGDKTEEANRFKRPIAVEEKRIVSEDSNTAPSSSESTAQSPTGVSSGASARSKKRPASDNNEDTSPSKRSRKRMDSADVVAESLMMMSNKQK